MARTLIAKERVDRLKILPFRNYSIKSGVCNLEVTNCDFKLKGKLVDKRLASYLYICFAATFLVGCAGSKGLQTNMLDEVQRIPVCCATLQEIQFQHLAFGKHAIEVDARLPTFAFDTGKSLFAAYSLPETTSGSRIVIRSFTHSGYGGLFQPDLLLLDSNKKVRRRIANPLFGQLPVSTAPFSPGYVQSEFEIEAADRFLVIRTTDDLVSRSTQVKERALLPTGASSTMPISTVGVLLSRPMGRMELELIKVQ